MYLFNAKNKNNLHESLPVSQKEVEHTRTRISILTNFQITLKNEEI